jgi:uncharacterized protein YkwD
VPARSLLVATLSILSCSVLSAVADPAVAYSRHAQTAVQARTHGHLRAAKPARAGCAKGPARLSRRARKSGRCKADTPTRTSNHRSTRSSRRTTIRARKRAPRVLRSKSSAPDEGAGAAAGTQTPAAEQSSAQSEAASIAAVLATPCENTELTPEAENIALVRAAVLCLINHKRAENSENPLQISPQLEQAAEGHCQELISDDYFAHVSPTGETPVDRIRATGYIPGPSDGYVIGENLAWGTYQLATAQSIVSAWIASPGHLANILEAQYRETGIGVTPAVPASLSGGAPGATYAQEFGVIIG